MAKRTRPKGNMRLAKIQGLKERLIYSFTKPKEGKCKLINYSPQE